MQGGHCIFHLKQIWCFESKGFLAGDHPQTIGDVVLYPFSKATFENRMKAEYVRRNQLASMACDKSGFCVDPAVYGQGPGKVVPGR
jgi:hypothetical protein